MPDIAIIVALKRINLIIFVTDTYNLTDTYIKFSLAN